MQIKLLLKPRIPLKIPFNYNHQLQSAIYAKLKENGNSGVWHNQGISSDGKFKAFVFGELKGDYVIKNKQICFEEYITLEVRSTNFKFFDELQRCLELKPTIKLYDTVIDVLKIGLSNVHINKNQVIFESVSPVVVRKKQLDGSTVYLKPDEPEFVNNLKRNFCEKYKAIYKEQPEEIEIIPLGEHKKTVTQYKGIWVTGYSGNYCVKGNSKSLELIYNSGLGIKNSQGFGLVNIIE
jgi:CRISPR-associated endoribonuclease Cas6